MRSILIQLMLAGISLLSSAQSKPNILIIVVDDGRYDNYPFSQGPSWFECPNIERIADEGVNFKYCFPATSVCAPSRANIVTGLYPHHTGVLKNGVSDSLTVPTIATVLQEHGYHTGFVGKYGFNKWPVPGLDYWFTSANDDYWDTYYNYFGDWEIIPGHKTEIFNDSAKSFLRNAPEDKPWCLFLFHKAPHSPYHPRPADTLLYVNETMPVPVNFYPHTVDFPSYYFWCHVYNGDSVSVQQEYLKYYQLLAGIEWSVGEMITLLEDSSELDSTLIIYTSDNGLLRGEHKLAGKQLALEESLRLPLFVRYPKWFAAGSVVEDRMASLIDIAPTAFEAAGITDPPDVDGRSLYQLYTGQADRQEFMYEFYNVQECTPTIHAVRTFDYLYVESSCEDSVVELYDLATDSLMNWNVVKDPAYSGIAAMLKQKLDSLRIAFGDTVWTDTIVPCYLYSTVPTPVEEVVDAPEEFGLYPNPGGSDFFIHIPTQEDDEVFISVFDPAGRRVYAAPGRLSTSGIAQIRLESGPPGLYFVQVTYASGTVSASYLRVQQY